MKIESVYKEAIQFDRDNFVEFKDFCEGRAGDITIERRPNGNCMCMIRDIGLIREFDFILKEPGIEGLTNTDLVIVPSDVFYRFMKKETDKTKDLISENNRLKKELQKVIDTQTPH